MRKQNAADGKQRTKNRRPVCEGTLPPSARHIGSERGVVLVLVIVLSAVVLTIMTALIYMITAGTQVSGLQKSYKTALEAGEGGVDVFYEFISTRAQSQYIATLTNQLNSGDLNSDLTTPPGCTGSLASGVTYTGLQARLMTPSTSWVGCDRSLSIDPANPDTYDMKIELGTTTKYNVYAKIVGATDGNTGRDSGLRNQGVTSGGSGGSGGEIMVPPIPYLYAVEVLSEKSSGSGDRAKLSVLYQH